jgi:hypothetical protein
MPQIQAQIRPMCLPRLITLLACLTATLTAPIAAAATPKEAMRWLAGRWTSDDDCKAAWISFERKGKGWIYRELAYDKGRPLPAMVSADAAGLVTVRITVPDGEYGYVNTFSGKDAFEAVEKFTSPTGAGDPVTKAYTRCK